MVNQTHFIYQSLKYLNMNKLNEFLDNFSSAQKLQINRSLMNLSRFARIGHELTAFNTEKKEVIFSLRQLDRTTEKIYQPEEMAIFFCDHLKPIRAAGWQIQTNCQTYFIKGLDFVTAEWVKEHMQRSGINLNKINHELQIEPATMDKVLNEEYGMSRWHKAAFYYYFQYKSLCLSNSK
jgi:hypothetical protein